LYACGSPHDSRWMMFRAQLTKYSGQYCSTSGRQYSTSRLPAASAGQRGDHIVAADVVGGEDGLVVVVVVVIDGGAGAS
jgi:hypothetical protein